MLSGDLVRRGAKTALGDFECTRAICGAAILVFSFGTLALRNVAHNATRR
jgi:hypothetical protein